MSLERYQQLLKDYVWSMRDQADISDLAETGALQLGRRTIGLWLEPDEQAPDESQVICRCDVVQIDPTNRRSIYRALLEANCLWQGTEGATLALRDNEIVIISIAQRLGSLTAERLHELLESLARDANRWERVLRRSGKPTGKAKAKIPATYEPQYSYTLA